MKNWLNIACFWMLMGLIAACSKEHTPEWKEGNASLTLEVATSALTRASAPGNGDLYNGGGMEDLTVVLVNSSNVIAAKQQVTGLTENDQKIKVVTLDGLDVGNYTLYVLANTERGLFSEAKTLLSGLNVGDLWNKDALFTPLTGTDVPTMNDHNPLLLTAAKAVTLGINDNYTTIDLLRPIVWFQVKLYNHSDKEMEVSNLSFGNFNPSTGYLFPHDGAVPSSVQYRSLPASGGGITVSAGKNWVVYETTLFENNAPDSYTMSMTLQTEGSTMVNATSIATNTRYALKNRSNYLVDNDGTLGVATYTGVVPDEALWTFSGTSSGFLTNVGTGNKFYRSTSHSDSGDNLTFNNTNGILKINYTTGSGMNKKTFYLRDSNSEVKYENNNSYNQWQLQTISGQASLTNAPLMTVNNETGAVEKMNKQIRNQHITVTVNAYYNEKESTFEFEVEPWTEKNAGVEFN